MNIDKIISLLIGPEYYTIDDLRYNKNVGTLFSKEDLSSFFEVKNKLVEQGYEHIVNLPLKTFNSKHIFFVSGMYLLNNVKEYLSAIVEDFKKNQSFLTSRNMDDILLSRIFSEIEGTLNIENVPTTKKRISRIYTSKNLTDKNDVIIKNMIDAIMFIINERPPFNKQNLFRLYSILSNGCLSEETKLKEDAYYRDGDVYIGGYPGVKSELIDEYMTSLFDFVNGDGVALKVLLPHICHYYILYLHPYFDYNGRTARMVSFWISVINDLMHISPLFMSEAINENKGDYYRAIVNTRNSENDLTYFLGYIMETSINFSLVYKNLEEIEKKLAKTGDFLTNTDLMYLKKILIHGGEGYFSCKMFMEYVSNDVTKQGAAKILKRLCDYGVIVKSLNKNNENIYNINPEFITYKLN